jgi:hypothetical protein
MILICHKLHIIDIHLFAKQDECALKVINNGYSGVYVNICQKLIQKLM